MIAWVSPSLVVRSTPLRISLVPVPSVPVSTVTCRSRISSVAIVSFLFSQMSSYVGSRPAGRPVDGRRMAGGSAGPAAHRGVDVDEDVVADHLDRVDGHRLGRRGPARLAGAQVEAGPVQPALDLAALHLPLGERDG